MEARAWTGDDDRDFGIADETCGECGAGPLDDCDPRCVCDHCIAHREREAEDDGEVFRGGEAAAYERDQMARIQRELK